MTPTWYKRELEDGMSGLDVTSVQRKVGADLTGIYDEDTSRRVRGVQLSSGLSVNGRVDEATASRLGERADHGQTPEWFHRTMRLGDSGRDVLYLRYLLGLTATDESLDCYDPVCEAAVRREQSARRITPTGEVDASFVLAY